MLTYTSNSTGHQIGQSRHVNPTVEARSLRFVGVVAAKYRFLDLSPLSISRLSLYSVRRFTPSIRDEHRVLSVTVVSESVPLRLERRTRISTRTERQSHTVPVIRVVQAPVRDVFDVVGELLGTYVTYFLRRLVGVIFSNSPASIIRPTTPPPNPSVHTLGLFDKIYLMRVMQNASSTEARIYRGVASFTQITLSYRPVGG